MLANMVILYRIHRVYILEPSWIYFGNFDHASRGSGDMMQRVLVSTLRANKGELRFGSRVAGKGNRIPTTNPFRLAVVLSRVLHASRD